MTESIEIQPVTKPVRARVRPPGSKSITNRALVCAALADGTSTLTGALDSEDTQVMIGGLRQLGIKIELRDLGRTLVCTGANGRVPKGSTVVWLPLQLECSNSGTTIRFLTAVTTLGHGMYLLGGVERMRERPIADLLDALNQLGAHTRSEKHNGCPPVMVDADGLPGGTATVRGDISSQFLSALLMVAPAAKLPVKILLAGPLVSKPYVRMTLAVMRAFGVEVDTTDPDSFRVGSPLPYHACDYAIEPDASAASYFWAAAAITGGEITVEGLSAASLQGDVAFVDCLAAMGCEVRRDADSITVVGRPLRGIDVDMNSISDTVQTLAVVALLAAGSTTIRNVAHIRHKETDRIVALSTELRKLGAMVEERDDGLTITPGKLQSATIDTYRDHRMAMSFALAGLRQPGVRINDPGCTAKTYPNYFDDLARAVEK